MWNFGESPLNFAIGVRVKLCSQTGVSIPLLAHLLGQVKQAQAGSGNINQQYHRKVQTA
jgi:hypothetical protein